MNGDFFGLVNFFDRMFEEIDFFSRPFDFHLDFSNIPPANIFIRDNKDIEFEFALAGYPMENIHISFDGDYMKMSAKKVERKEESGKFIHKGIKSSEIKQSYYIPSSKYNAVGVKAKWKNGILKVFVPSKEQKEVQKIEIEKV